MQARDEREFDRVLCALASQLTGSNASDPARLYFGERESGYSSMVKLLTYPRESSAHPRFKRLGWLTRR